MIHIDRNEFTNLVKTYQTTKDENYFTSSVYPALEKLTDMIIYKYTGKVNVFQTKNRENKESIKQDMFLKFFECIDKYDPSRDAFSYFYTVLNYECQEKNKKYGNLINKELTFTEYLPENVDVDELIGVTEEEEEIQEFSKINREHIRWFLSKYQTITSGIRERMILSFLEDLFSKSDEEFMKLYIEHSVIRKQFVPLVSIYMKHYAPVTGDKPSKEIVRQSIKRIFIKYKKFYNMSLSQQLKINRASENRKEALKFNKFL